MFPERLVPINQSLSNILASYLQIFNNPLAAGGKLRALYLWLFYPFLGYAAVFLKMEQLIN